MRHNLDPVPIAYQGSDFHWEVGFRDTTTGDVFDFTAPANADLELRTQLLYRNGKVLATFDNLGTGDGTLTGDADGILAWDLPGAVVATLPVTRDYRTSGEPRTFTWRTRHQIVFGLSATDHDLDETWTLLDSQLVVCPPLT